MNKFNSKNWLQFTLLLGVLVLPVHVWTMAINPASATFHFETDRTQIELVQSEMLHAQELYNDNPLSLVSHPDARRVEPMVDYLTQSTYVNASLREISGYPTGKHPWVRNGIQTNNICEDINTANVAILRRVRGISLVKAQAIIDYRNQFGPFKSLDELSRVKGIGPATVENFRKAGFCVQESNSTNENPRNSSNETTTIDSNCKDVNTANAEQLQRVRRIGRTKAQAIIDYRNQFGPFKSLNELTRVKGIGPATLQNFREAGFCVSESGSSSNRSDTQTQVPSNNSTTNNTNCIDVNNASAAQLQRVRRIGRVKAQAIVDYRNQFGPFKSLDELTRVKGIGPATLQNFREAEFCVSESDSSSNHSDTQTQAPSNNSTTTDANCNDVNKASAAQLQRVKRIGPVKSQAIIDYRNRSGPFKSLDELTRVRGIGPATLENFRRAGFCVQASTSSNDNLSNQTQATLTDSTMIDTICEDINTVNATELQRVKGIGPVKSQAIIRHRNQSGPFESLDALLDVKGIDADTLNNFQESGFCVTVPDNGVDSMGVVTNTPNTSYTPGYPPSVNRRSLYGGWLDVDEDCQNTRHEVLISRSRIEPILDETECIVISGEWYDPYTGMTITDPGELDIDHFIPLAEAHRSGGAAWNDSLRHAFGNDLSENGVLIPVLASVNRSKGDRDPADWLPPNESYHCQYIERWMNLKEIWKLTMDYHERQAVEDLQSKCGSKSKLP